MIVAISDQDDVHGCSDEYDTTSESLNSLDFSSRDSSITSDSDTSMESHSSSPLSYKDSTCPTKHTYNEEDMCNVINRCVNDHDSQTFRGLPSPPDNSGGPD